MARKVPSSKTKLLTLHVDGKKVNVGMAEFVHDALAAAGNRSQGDLERVNNGDPTIHVNAAGDLVVYVDQWSV